MTELGELSCEERYDHSLSEIVEERELWILINASNEFLKIFAQAEDFEYLPIWPSLAEAQAYAGDDSSLSPKSISLPEFQKRWVPGLTRDGLEVGVFPGRDHSVWLMQAEELKQDIQDELANF